MTLPTEIDALVIGGGPGGSTAATVLAQAGFSVLVAEKERFPRFHIGESLLPYNVPLFERLGVWQRLLDHGFQHKWGARFVFEPAMEEVRLDFPSGIDRRYPMALQVRRAKLDQILLQRSREVGAEVREATEVRRVHFEGGRASGAELVDDQGETRQVRARVVIDASGRDTLLGRQLTLKGRDPALRQAALFGHFEGAEMGLGREGGDILIVGGVHGWFWMIPLDGKTASVGLVFPGRLLAERPEESAEELFHRMVASSPTVSARLRHARAVSPMRPTADFSYRCSQLAGDGWVLAGDAAAFLDPVFSSGVLLAMRTAEHAAEAVVRAFSRHGRVDRRDLRRYERFALRGLDRFRSYILAYYDEACSSIFRTEPPRLLAAATISAFAGKVFERDPRIWLFDRFFFGISAARRRAAARGRLTLPAAPAHDSG